MSAPPTWFTGDRNPAITDTVTIDGVGVDLTAKTTTFKMRAVGSETLKVNSAVTTKEADGNWTYGWGATDLDTAGDYLVWVTVDMGGGALQTVNEALIRVLDHGTLNQSYVELEEFKATAELTGKTFADGDIRTALIAASRGIEDALGRRFYPDADATQIRYYTPELPHRLWIDDLITLTSFQTDDGGDGTFENTWTEVTDFVLGPLNAAADGKPYMYVEVNAAGSQRLPCNGYPRSVKVTGKFGWATAPLQVKTLTTLIAARLVKRTRSAPFGGVVGLDLEGSVLRATGYARDPDYAFLTNGLDRSIPVG